MAITLSVNGSPVGDSLNVTANAPVPLAFAVTGGGVLHVRYYTADWKLQSVQTLSGPAYNVQSLPLPIGSYWVKVEQWRKGLPSEFKTFSLKVAASTPTEPSKPPEPTPEPPVEPSKPTLKSIDGTIVENDRVAQTSGYLRELGIKLIRNWCSINWSTGKINWTDCIKRTNEYTDAGFDTILTVSVDEISKRSGNRCPDFGTAAIAQQFDGLNRKTIIQIANEINLDNYWPKGDVVEANKLFCVPLGKRLKAMGFKLASPSLTWQTASRLVQWWDAMRPDTPQGLWDYIDGHSYSKNVSDLDKIMGTYADIAKSFGVTAISTEWGMPHGEDHQAFVDNKLIPFRQIMRKHTSHNVYFIGTWTEKFASKNRCPYFFRTTPFHKGLAWDAIKASKQ